MASRPGSSSRGAIGTRTEHPSSTKPDDLVILGELGRPHGLRGEIRLKSYTGDPLAIAGYSPLVTADGRRVVIADAKPAPGASPDILVVSIEGVADRTGAEALTRQALYCARAVLGEPEDEDEVFTADLIGLDAVDTTGAVIGSIVAVPNYGGGDLLEIRPALGGATALLPFTKAFVPTIDIANRRVVVDPPEDFFAPPGPKPDDEPA